MAPRRPVVMGLVLALQVVCAGFFLFQIAVTIFGLPIPPINWTVFELLEIGAALGLILGVVVSTLALRRSLVATAQAEEKLRAASGAFYELVIDRFSEWQLTPAERDVALFALKGLSTQEIAELRRTSEGTVKAQTNAIYRKAEVSGRTQLLSLFIDDLMQGPIA